MVKVIYHEDFNKTYCSDPAAAPGRIESVMKSIRGKVELVKAQPATLEDIAAVHTRAHIEKVIRDAIYEIACLAAGGAIQAAEIGLQEPCFAVIRPPGHHASSGSAWGFCYFNNMAIALEKLKRENRIQNAFVLDFDLHYGDGTSNILDGRGWVTLYNPSASDPDAYLRSVKERLFAKKVDIIGVCAGFDNHVEDWGGLLSTSDYRKMGKMVREASRYHGGGCFGILEGGYNHRVLGDNVMAFIEGLDGA